MSTVRLSVAALLVTAVSMVSIAEAQQPPPPAPAPQPAAAPQPAPAPAPAAAAAQPTPPSGTLTSTPAVLVIYREEVRPGRAAAHAANEANWAAAFTKAGAPVRWLGMTSVIGPSEAWFLSAYPSYEAFEQADAAADANAALTAEADRMAAQDTDHLTRTSVMIAGYRPGMSYQADVSLPQMRFMQVDVVRVKPGYEGDFRSAWRSIVEAHTESKMDEHWALYEVEAGGEDGTFLFFYPRKSMAEIDRVGPTHGADAYRTAVGESGRQQQREMTRNAIASSQTYMFRLRPSMSVLTSEWTDVDPGFWTPKPQPAPVKK